MNYGLDDWFGDLAAAFRSAGWSYHFDSAGRYELAGECWEWAPGWPAERRLIQSGEIKALDRPGVETALAEARALGVDPADYLLAVLAPWPGRTAPAPATPAASADTLNPPVDPRAEE